MCLDNLYTLKYSVREMTWWHCCIIQIEQVNLVLDLDTGRSKGFGFVTVSIGNYVLVRCNFMVGFSVIFAAGNIDWSETFVFVMKANALN